MQDKSLNALIVETLDDNKAENITELDVRELTDIMDTMVICTATSTRHAKTLADKVLRASKNIGIRPLGIEGEDKGDWVLIDFNDVVIHIMLQEVRDFYSLEKLWTITEHARKQARD